MMTPSFIFPLILSWPIAKTTAIFWRYKNKTFDAKPSAFERRQIIVIGHKFLKKKLILYQAAVHISPTLWDFCLFLEDFQEVCNSGVKTFVNSKASYLYQPQFTHLEIRANDLKAAVYNNKGDWLS